MNTPIAAMSLDFDQLRRDECKRLDENDLCDDECKGCSLNSSDPINEYRLFIANLALSPEVK